MKYRLIILFFSLSISGYAGTFDTDTIDFWKIYNGSELVLSGNEFGAGHFKGTIRKSELKEMNIKFYCDAPREVAKIINLRDDRGKTILTKTFPSDSRNGLIISRGELRKVTSKRFTIRYREKAENGRDIVLGEIEFL